MITRSQRTTDKGSSSSRRALESRASIPHVAHNLLNFNNENRKRRVSTGNHQLYDVLW